jgi:hypothetical protein
VCILKYISAKKDVVSIEDDSFAYKVGFLINICKTTVLYSPLITQITRIKKFSIRVICDIRGRIRDFMGKACRQRKV